MGWLITKFPGDNIRTYYISASIYNLFIEWPIGRGDRWSPRACPRVVGSWGDASA